MKRETFEDLMALHVFQQGGDEDSGRCGRDSAGHKILAEFDRLRDCERVAWCRSHQSETVFMVSSAYSGQCLVAYGEVIEMDYHFTIENTADPARVRAIIDREMKTDHIADASKMVNSNPEVTK